MTTTIDNQELAKFAQHANDWWDTEGPLKTLHDINALRLSFIENFISFSYLRVNSPADVPRLDRGIQGSRSSVGSLDPAVKPRDVGKLGLAGKRILDVGCGGGILSEALAKAGAIVVGIDAEPEAIATATKHAQAQGLAITYHCTPIEDFETEAFDGITCMEMLEHVPNPALVLTHCKRLLKPEGRLFLSTINRTAKAYASAILVAEYLLNLLPRQTHDFDKFIKPSELAGMLRPLDLDILAIKGMDYNPLTRSASLSEDVSVNYLMACGV